MFMVRIPVLVVLIILLFAGYVGYGLYAERIAERRAKMFCDSVRPGEDAEAVLARAKTADGAEERMLRWFVESGRRPRTLRVMFVGLPPFSRHTCVIEAEQKVIKAEYLHYD